MILRRTHIFLLLTALWTLAVALPNLDFTSTAWRRSQRHTTLQSGEKPKTGSRHGFSGRDWRFRQPVSRVSSCGGYGGEEDAARTPSTGSALVRSGRHTSSSVFSLWGCQASSGSPGISPDNLNTPRWSRAQLRTMERHGVFVPRRTPPLFRWSMNPQVRPGCRISGSP